MYDIYKLERKINLAEKELELLRPFLEKYDLQINYVKFFEDRLNIQLRHKKAPDFSG